MVACLDCSRCGLTTGVVRVLWFKQQDPHLFLGHRAMLHPFGHDNDFSWADFHSSVSKFQGHLSFDDVKQFVLFRVGMPHELTLNLRELHVLSVELRNDFGRPLFFKQPKLLRNGNGLHGRQGNPRRDGEGAVPWSRAIQMHIPERMIRRMAKLLGGSLAGQLVAFGAAFVLARIYGPEAYAHLEIFALVTGIGAVLGTGKFEQALMLPKSEKDALGLLWAGQRFVWATVLLVAVVGIGSAHWVAETWSLPSWRWIAWSLPVFTGLAAHARLLEYWHHRQSQVGHVAVAKASGPFLSELTKWGSAGWFPLMGLSLGSGAGIAMRWAIMRRGLNSVCQAASPWGRSPSSAAIQAHRDYPTWVLLGSAMNRLAQWLHVLLIGATLGPLMLGWMGMARRMVMLPLSLLATSAAPVLFKSAMDRANGAPLRRLFFQAFIGFGLVATLVGLAVFLAPDETTAWLFGAPWRGAIDVLRILAPWFVLNFISAGLGSMFHRVRKTKWIAALDAVHLLAVGLGWFLGTLHPEWFGGGEWGALQGIVWAKCGYYVLNLGVLVKAVIQHQDEDR